MTGLDEAFSRFERDMQGDGWEFNMGTRWRPAVRLYKNVSHPKSGGGETRDCVTGYGSGPDLVVAFYAAMDNARVNEAAWVEKMRKADEAALMARPNKKAG